MSLQKHRRGRGFSLVELVIVVVIIGVIAAIAIPRMTSGANRAGSNALRANLQVLRNAIELYRAEHNGTLPTVSGFVAQMTQYSNYNGSSTGSTYDPDTGLTNGPYLAAIPELPVGAEKGSTTVAGAAGIGVAWIYNATAGTISANTGTAEDQDGTLYTTY